MPSAEPSSVAIGLLQERSRDALVEGLKAALTELGQPEIGDEAIAFLADLLLAAGADRDHLKDRLVRLLSKQFGRRSEKSTSEQIELFAEALRFETQSAATGEDSSKNEPPSPETAAEIIERTNTEIAAETEARRQERAAGRAARREAAKLDGAVDGDAVPWPTHLPIREETRVVPDAHIHCGDCGEERQVIRYEQSWRIEYQTTAEVVVTRTPVVACKSHHGGPLSEPVPPKPVDKGQMGFSLAAHILWLRITHNLPVRRIAEMMQAEGVPVSEQAIHTLIRESGERSRRIVEAIRGAVQQAALVNIDDTYTDVYEDEGSGRRRRIRNRARVWLALGDERYAYFFGTKTWKADEAAAALGPIAGVLQGDGYKGFVSYAEKHAVLLAGCMAHLRRKLRAAFDAKDPRAARPIALVNGMYRVEELARLRRLAPEARLALRRERSAPLMAELLEWAAEVAPTIVTGSPLGKAWTYLNNQQEPLQVFLHNGVVSIDNNAAERGLRRHTIGRKLWLFFRDQDKLEHVARLMSVLTTARLQGVDERAYLAWLLEQLARREWSGAAAARMLLPEHWLALQEQKAE